MHVAEGVFQSVHVFVKQVKKSTLTFTLLFKCPDSFTVWSIQGASCRRQFMSITAAFSVWCNSITWTWQLSNSEAKLSWLPPGGWLQDRCEWMGPGLYGEVKKCVVLTHLVDTIIILGEFPPCYSGTCSIKPHFLLPRKPQVTLNDVTMTCNAMVKIIHISFNECSVFFK